ncbi:dTMP kinase [Alkalimonas sp.]|uniref:dTMP kinase n=1 Tax=Alkalimonas sp. TaxID=1872453 RepID=UPI00263B6EA2|nr:dTMP kinase [Alkalimonas sp.]MCC5824688.1 dTMP kinase [Alkalimonas sp.]
MSEQGRFLVVEGLEGAGKSTAVVTVRQWLEAKRLSVVCTREPGGTPLAEQIRTLVKQVHDEQLTAEAELLLMYAARVQLLRNVIEPALSAGHWVLADRHDLSSRAYQGGGRQLDRKLIDGIRQAVLGNCKPDLTLYLDIDPAIGLARALARGELDRIEQEQLVFFQRTRQVYLQIAASEPGIVVIDASRPLLDVQQSIVAALDAFWEQGHAALA